LSKNTIHDYANTFRKFVDFLGEDLPMGDITPVHIRSFLAAQTVSKKSILNYHIGLSALWTWAFNEGLVSEHIVRKVRRPRPEKKAIKPYSEADIKTLLSSLRYSKAYNRPGKRETSTRWLKSNGS